MGEIVNMNDDADVIILPEDDNSIERLAGSEEYFKNLIERAPGLKGIEALAELLEMPDEVFEQIKPIMLEELETEFNNSNNKYDLAMSFGMSGTSVEDLRKGLDEVMGQIDTEFERYDESRRAFLKQIFAMIGNSLEKGVGTHNRIIRIPIEICNPDAHIPTYAHDTDAGCDVYALDDYTVEPNQTMLLPLGFKVAVPVGYELQMRPRSGMSLKTKIRVANAPGTIDSGYRGEVGLIIDNIADRPFYITKGMRIAQMVLSEVPVASFYQVNSIAEFDSDRGEGGYGSSGK